MLIGSRQRLVHLFVCCVLRVVEIVAHNSMIEFASPCLLNVFARARVYVCVSLCVCVCVDRLRK